MKVQRQQMYLGARHGRDEGAGGAGGGGGGKRGCQGFMSQCSLQYLEGCQTTAAWDFGDGRTRRRRGKDEGLAAQRKARRISRTAAMPH